MTLREYFEKTTGTGVLATADASGKVNAAIYGRPHFFDDQAIAFIMADRLTYANLQENDSAVYLFRETGDRYVGKRLYLTKTGELDEPALINEIRLRPHPGGHPDDHNKKRYLVSFHIDKVLPLIGNKIE
jgi:hypothetical protein